MCSFVCVCVLHVHTGLVYRTCSRGISTILARSFRNYTVCGVIYELHSVTTSICKVYLIDFFLLRNKSAHYLGYCDAQTVYLYIAVSVTYCRGVGLCINYPILRCVAHLISNCMVIYPVCVCVLAFILALRAARWPKSRFSATPA